MKKNHYINNKKLQEELLIFNQKLQKCRSNNEPDPQASNYIGECIMFIANRYATKYKFYAYTNLWKEEMISDGIEDCFKYGIKNYDPVKFSNPLAYFTEVIHWAFVRRIKREKLEQYKKLKNQQTNEHLLTLTTNKTVKNTENEVADNLIHEFERKAEEEKKKRINAKKGIELFAKED